MPRDYNFSYGDQIHADMRNRAGNKWPTPLLIVAFPFAMIIHGVRWLWRRRGRNAPTD